MKREAAYSALVIALVLSLVVAGFPLAQMVMDHVEHENGRGTAGDGPLAGGAGGADASYPVDGDATNTPGSGSTAGDDGTRTASGDAASSYRGPAAATPDHLSDIFDLLLSAGAAASGRPVELPHLDVSVLPPVNPLRFAITSWVAATGADVPPGELDAALADADALPQNLQRDLAILLLASSEATLLQRSALADLTPEEIEFLETHPDAARALAGGAVSDPDALRAAHIASKVDVSKSLQATLLLLGAVHETRDALSAYTPEDLAAANSLTKELPVAADVVALLEAVHAANAGTLSRQEKVRLAGDLLANASGIAPADDPRPYAPAVVSSDTPLADALVDLLAASYPAAPPEVEELLKPQILRANALPIELQRALALVLAARADAIVGVRDAALAGASDEDVARATALGTLRSLSAMEQALPAIEKFSILWSQAPRAQRLGIVDPALGYADAVTRATSVTKGGENVQSALAAAVGTSGVRAEPLAWREMTFRDAYAHMIHAFGKELTPEELAEINDAANGLPPEVRRAAAILMVGTADASLARERAFADLTPAHVAWLFANAEDVTRIVESESTTDGDLALLRAYADVAARLNATALAEGALTLARATDEARAVLDDARALHEAGQYETYSLGVRPVRSGVAGLFDNVLDTLAKLVPWKTARAQADSSPLYECATYEPAIGAFSDCANGIILRLNLFGAPTILILDSSTTVVTPSLVGSRNVPVILDLGGDDVYRLANGAVPEGHTPSETTEGALFYEGSAFLFYNEFWLSDNPTYYASVLFDYDGDDRYTTPNTYLHRNPLTGETREREWIGSNGAGLGAIGMIVDVGGSDRYRSYSHSQGFGWFGVGVLADLGSGSDDYTAPFLAQGATYGGFGINIGLLLDQGGDDDYVLTLPTGQGWGAGAFLADLDGDDDYSTATPRGIDTTAYTSLDLEPGSLLAKRGDSKIWADGPNPVNLGVGIDAIITYSDGDSDFFPAYLEGLLESSDNNPDDHPTDGFLRSFGNTTRDFDRDGWPDSIERAMGTSPTNPNDAPAGIPDALAAALAPAFAQLLGDVYQPGNFGASDKLLDVRVPFPGNRLHLNAFCDDYFAWRAPATMLGTPGEGPPASLFGIATIQPAGPPTSNEPENPTEYSECQLEPSRGPYPMHNWTFLNGGGNTTLSNDGTIRHGGNAETGEELRLTVPAGIFALGDVGTTTYYVDYLATIDLGGMDFYNKRAGGGGYLLYHMDSTGPEKDRSHGLHGSLQAVDGTSTTAAVGYVSIDVDTTLIGLDSYSATGDDGPLGYAHGALGGILLDTQGQDFYTAGSRSQGAFGGVLLDLDGNDQYTARDLSQGAAFAAKIEPATKATTAEGLARSKTLTDTTLAARPSMLLDFAGNDTYTAGTRAQGYARGYGYADAGSPGVIPTPIGALVDFGGRDSYDGGLFAQGAARGGGAGILFDGDGDDDYVAASGVSQGAIEPETYFDDTIVRFPTATNVPDSRQVGGLGMLADGGGRDNYTVWLGAAGSLDRSAARQNDLTIRPELGPSHTVNNRAIQFATGYGVHADGEHSNADSDADGMPDSVEFVAGTGVDDAADSPTEMGHRGADGYLVNLPTARLAIGGFGDQEYRHDYAFLVDLGGDNSHLNNAGGPILDLALTDGGSSQARLRLTEFPVTFLYETAASDTTYSTARDFAQAVGYFTVGVVVDEGGADVFDVAPPHRHVFPSRYTNRTVSIDGTINDFEWRSSANATFARGNGLTFQDLNATESRRPVEFFMTNDLERAYFGVRYEVPPGTGTTTEQILRNNWFDFYFDENNDQSSWYATGQASLCSAPDQPAGASGADRVRVNATREGTFAPLVLDGFLRGRHGSTGTGWTGNAFGSWRDDCRDATSGATNQDAIAKRTYDAATKTITIEMSKPLTGLDSRQDFQLTPDGLGGWVNPEVGFRMAFGSTSTSSSTASPTVTGQTFVWPPLSAGTNGETGSGALRDGEMAEELRSWGVLKFAALPDVEAPIAYGVNESLALGEAETNVSLVGVTGAPLEPQHGLRVLTQGAGFGGVGVLAAIGNAGSSSTLETDRWSQGFGAFGGIGVLYDGGGSDVYRGSRFVQGASILSGYGLFVETEGNDVFTADAQSQGFAFGVNNVATGPAEGLTFRREAGGAVFADANGYDTYVYGAEAKRSVLRANLEEARNAHEFAPYVLPDGTLQFADGQSNPFNDRVWTEDAEVAGIDLEEFENDVHDAIPDNPNVPELPRIPDVSAVWGLGVDYRTLDSSIFMASQYYRDVAWAPKVEFTFGTPTASGCDPVDPAGGTPTAPIYLLKNESCVRAFVYFDSIFEEGVRTERVDVFASGVLLESLTHGVETTGAAAGFPLLGDEEGLLFVVDEWDLADYEDGPVLVDVMPFFATDMQAAGPASLPERVMFTVPKSITVFVDNAPRVAAQAFPSTPDGFGHAFSPYAVGEPRSLDVDWAPAHDVGEDRLPYAGYTFTQKNEQCNADVAAATPGGLCNVMSMWVDINNRLTQAPPPPDVDDPIVVLRSLSWEDGKEWRLTPEDDLPQDVVFPAGTSLRLNFFRAPVVTSNYTTVVRILDGSNQLLHEQEITVGPQGLLSNELPDTTGVIEQLGEVIQLIDDTRRSDIRCVVTETYDKNDGDAELDGAMGHCLRDLSPTLTWLDGYMRARCQLTGQVYCLEREVPTFGPVRYGTPVPVDYINTIDALYREGDAGEVHVGRTSMDCSSIHSAAREHCSAARERLPIGDHYVQVPPDGVDPGLTRLHAYWVTLNCAIDDAAGYEKHPQCSGDAASASSGAPASGSAPDGATAAAASGDAGNADSGFGGSEVPADGWNVIDVTLDEPILVPKGESFTIIVQTFVENSFTRNIAGYADDACDVLAPVAGNVYDEWPRNVTPPPGPLPSESQFRQRYCLNTNGNAIPAPDYINLYGTADYPARVDFLLTTDASTNVSIRAQKLLYNETGVLVEDDNVLRVLDDGGVKREGDIGACTHPDGRRPACRGFTWDAAGLPSGVYDIEFRPTTTTPALHPLSGRADESPASPDTLRVLVDNTSPRSVYTMPQTEAIRNDGVMLSVLGEADFQGSEFPIRFVTTDDGAAPPRVTGSGVDFTQVWIAPATDDGEIPEFSKWRVITHGTVDGRLPAGTREVTSTAGANERAFYVAVVSRDRVGNIEGLPPPVDLNPFDSDPDTWVHQDCFAGGHLDENRDRCIDLALQAAVQHKINLTNRTSLHPSYSIKSHPEGVFRVDLDLGRPVLRGAELIGSEEGLVGGVPRTIVKAGHSVQFRVCASDGEGESGVELVKVFFVRIPDDPSAPIDAHNETMAPVGGDCYAYTGWGSVNTNKTLFPDGPWAIGFEATDRGGNKAELELGDVYLDSEAPTVDAAAVRLPNGQTAVKPGDRFEVVLSVAEGISLAEGAVTLDARAVNRTGTIAFSSVNLEGFNYRATVLVDATGLASGTVSLPYRVRDAAGNVVSASVSLAVNVEDFEVVPGSVTVTNATYDSAEVRWRTTAPSTSRVLFGFGPFDLTKSTSTDSALVTDHVVTVTGLNPSTRYFVKAVSASASGLLRESDVTDFQTTTALFLDEPNLAESDAVSGDYELAWAGGLRGDVEGVAKFAVHVRRDSGPWEFVTTTSSDEDAHSVRINTSRLLDDDHYFLRITAESGRDAVNVTVGPFTIDNTVPTLTLTSSTKATRDATPLFEGIVADGLSGVDLASFRMSIDGETLPASRFVAEGKRADGTIPFTYAVEDTLALGPHDVVMSVADKAGATRTLAFTLRVDVVPPEASFSPVDYAPGPTAAKEDATVTLRVTATDTSGIESVVTNVSGLVSGDTALAFEPEDENAEAWVATFVVDDPAEDGVYNLPVTVSDPAGNAVTIQVPVLVDTTTPTLTGVRVGDVGYTSARLLAHASEAVTMKVAYSGRGSSGSAESATATSDPIVSMKGLLPSREYGFVVTATDGAGNVATQSGTFRTAEDTEAPRGVPVLRITDLGDGRVRLEWDAAEDNVGISHYRVYRAPEGGAFALIAETDGTNYVDDDVPLEERFTYRVAAVDHGGNEGTFSPLATGAATRPPVLTDGLVTPDLGSAGTTTFTFRINYSSPGGVAPTYVRVILNGVPHDMRKVDGDDPKTGLVYEYTTSLAATKLESPHMYHFEASDGRYIVKYPADASLKGPLVSGDLLSDKAAGFLSAAKRVPLTGALSVLGATVVAAAAIIIFRRRTQ